MCVSSDTLLKKLINKTGLNVPQFSRIPQANNEKKSIIAVLCANDATIESG
ncbi:MAG: hypothetical protein IKX14_00945 [Neisseriaceae bacterium]|nr:hypothetical protein [Neisseriaceae bacterium]